MFSLLWGSVSSFSCYFELLSSCLLSLTSILKLIDRSLHYFFRNMSSKRKSPPTKFQEGGGLVTPEDDSAAIVPATISVPNTLSSGGYGGSDGGGLTDVDESSSNNVSDVGDEDLPPQGATAASLYKLSHSSSSSPMSGSEPEDCPIDTHEPSPPIKKQRLLCPVPPQDIEYLNDMKSNLVPPPSALLPALSAIHLQHEHHQYQEPVDSSCSSRRRSSSDCSSPTLDIMMKAGTVNNHNNNNNNSMTHNNNSTSSSHPVKRTMDDVLKRLTSKMHISNVRDEKRPTPASTPTGKPVGWVTCALYPRKRIFMNAVRTAKKTHSLTLQSSTV